MGVTCAISCNYKGVLGMAQHISLFSTLSPKALPPVLCFLSLH